MPHAEKNVLHISLAQLNPTVGSLNRNLKKIHQVIDKESDYADLIIFPEMVVCGYPPEDLILKKAFLDDIETKVNHLIDESRNHDSCLVIPVPWRKDGYVYNVALVIQNGEIRDIVKKHHLPNYGVFDELRLFKSGRLPSPVNIKGHKIGLMICEDMWRDNVAAHLKNEGAEMLVVVNASPYEFTKNEKRLALACERATAHKLPLIYLNQVGGQDELVFDGASFILNESGTLIMRGESFAEGVYRTVWEKTANGHWICLSDDFFEPEGETESIYKAAMTGLRDYVTKNGFPGVLFGLSGGVDSALVAALSVDALGSEAVQTFMLPSRYTSQTSLDDAQAVARNLQIPCETISIEGTVGALEEAIKNHVNADTPPITFENLQSRARGVILMALSNASGKMVLSTGNKSEMAVGYATLYGDMNGGFNPLKDLYKTQVYSLCRWRNENKPAHSLGPDGPVIPENILTKPPSAELKPNQTDQDSLPPYDILDDILYHLIEKDLSVKAIAAKGHDSETVSRVQAMLDRAEYKRRQAPPGVKITSRAFGRDRRYPITNYFQKDS